MFPRFNPFKVRRAERLHDEEVLRTYCDFPTDLGLRSSTTVILEGARGSGKSTALRAVGALPRSPADDPHNRSDDGRLIIGTYLSFGPAWFAAFRRTRTLGMELRRSLFATSLNLSLALQLSRSLERYLRLINVEEDSRIDQDIEAAGLLAVEVLRLELPRRFSLADFRGKIDTAWRSLRDAVLRNLIGEKLILPHDILLDDALAPIQRTVEAITRSWELEGKVLWTFLLDEVDLLDIEAQRCLNSALREVRAPIALKLACLPHGHRTRETLTPEAHVTIPDDFEHSSIPTDPKKPLVQEFCARLYNSRCSNSEAPLPTDPKRWLGVHEHRERARDLLRENFAGKSWEEAVAASLDPHGDLFSHQSRTSNSLRQYVPALAMRLLRIASEGNRGQPGYAGWDDVVAASDGNPRRLFRLLDRLVEVSNDFSELDPTTQSGVIRSVAVGAFDRLLALPTYGRQVRGLVDQVAGELKRRLHESRLAADSTSIEFSLNDLADEDANVMRVAIGYGIFNPWEFSREDGYPQGRHNYSLSFGLAPHFWLVLRRGRAAFRLDENTAISTSARQLKIVFLIDPKKSEEPNSDHD